jgi:hypothetical protein
MQCACPHNLMPTRRKKDYEKEQDEVKEREPEPRPEGKRPRVITPQFSDVPHVRACIATCPEMYNGLECFGGFLQALRRSACQSAVPC